MGCSTKGGHRKHPKRFNMKQRELAEAPCLGSTCTPALGVEIMGLVFFLATGKHSIELRRAGMTYL